MADFEIKGLDKVIQNMRQLPVKLQKSGMRKAGTQSMRIVRDAARAAWRRVDDPATKESQIWKKVVTKTDARAGRQEGGIVTKVGIQGGAKSYKQNRGNRRSGRAGKSYHVESSATFHWRFYELGTSRQPARPIMVPAFVSNIDAVTAKYVSVLSAEIDKAIT